MPTYILTLVDKKLNGFNFASHCSMMQRSASVFSRVDVNISQGRSTFLDVIIFDPIEKLFQSRFTLRQKFQVY